MDSISGVGGVVVDMGENGADIVAGASQKCFELPPGLAPIAVGERAWAYMEKMNKKNPWEAILMTVPKGVHGKENPPEDVSTVAFVNASSCWDVFDEEIAYDLLKFLFDNAEEYARRLPAYEVGYGLGFYPGLTEEMLHPGALRYYKERGIKLGA